MAIPGARVPNTFFRSAADVAGVAGARGGGLGVAGAGDGEEVPPGVPMGGSEFEGADGVVGGAGLAGAGAAGGAGRASPADARTSSMYFLAWSGV